MQFPGEKRKYSQKTISFREDQLELIDAEAEALKRSRNQQVEYLIDLAIQAGSINSLIEKMANQHAEIYTRALLNQQEVATYEQVERLMDQQTYTDDNVRNLAEIVKRLGMTIVTEKEGVAKA